MKTISAKEFLDRADQVEEAVSAPTSQPENLRELELGFEQRAAILAWANENGGVDSVRKKKENIQRGAKLVKVDIDVFSESSDGRVAGFVRKGENKIHANGDYAEDWAKFKHMLIHEQSHLDTLIDLDPTPHLSEKEIKTLEDAIDVPFNVDLRSHHCLVEGFNEYRTILLDTRQEWVAYTSYEVPIAVGLENLGREHLDGKSLFGAFVARDSEQFWGIMKMLAAKLETQEAVKQVLS